VVQMTPDQKRTLELLLPNSIPTMALIVPRGNLPEQLYAEILPSDSAKLLVAGQRGMGKTTELRRLVELLTGSEFLPIFLQFGAQESITQPGLIHAMALSLYRDSASKLEKKSYEQFLQWYDREETAFEVEESTEGAASIGGDLLFLRAKGGVKRKSGKKNKKTRRKVRDTRELLVQFNALVDRSRRSSKKRIVFVVDDIDKVQDAASIENTFIHAAHLVGQISCPCIFTVPITYATSSYLRIAALPYTGIHRVPAVELVDQHGKQNEKAFDFMRKVFKLRMPFNPLPDTLLDKVLRNSGGVLIDAMRMLRGICKGKVLDPNLTIDDAVVDSEFQRLIDDYKFVFDRPVLWQKLSNFCRVVDKQAIMTDDSLPELLYKMIVIEYHQKNLWFDLHPAARKLYEQNAQLIDDSVRER
jgi:hypothetical protein